MLRAKVEMSMPAETSLLSLRAGQHFVKWEAIEEYQRRKMPKDFEFEIYRRLYLPATVIEPPRAGLVSAIEPDGTLVWLEESMSVCQVEIDSKIIQFSLRR